MRVAPTILLALGFTLRALAAGRDAPHLQSPQKSTAPTIQVYSRETIVDVVATGKDGQPVHGLSAADFAVEEDGRPQSIRSFAEIGPGAQQPVQQDPMLAAGVNSNLQAAASGPVNIILIDALNTAPPQMTIFKKQMIGYLRTMPKGTRVAIFALSASKGGRLVQGVTTDGATAAASLATIDAEWNRPPAIRRDATRAMMLQIVGYVSSIKGRKNLLWCTARMPLYLLRDGGYAWMRPPQRSQVDQNMDLFDAMTAAQIAISPVSLKGVGGLGLNELLAEAVAEGTGGTAEYNSNDFGSLVAKAIDSDRSYYTLSYVPPSFPMDTRYHTIRVKVDQPGVSLVYRKGFNAEQVGQEELNSRP
jgi:VWFA-related protein